MLKILEALKKHSTNYIAELDLWKTNFEQRVLDFFTSETMKCLVLETRDTRTGALRIRKVIVQLRKYKRVDDLIFLQWEQLLRMMGPTKVLPKFGNVLVLELSDHEPEYNDRHLLEELIERINIVPTKKAVLIFGQQYWPDTYLNGINVDAFLKINEFNNTVISLTDSRPYEFLYKSAVAGRTSHVKVLIEGDLKVNEPGDDKGNTALHGAAEFGDKNLVLQLLRNGALILANKSGDTPLHVAAEHGHNDVVTTLLNYQKDTDLSSVSSVDVNSKNVSGRTALHLAADLGRYLVVKTLLNYGANVNCEDNNDCTPLHFAAGFQESNIVELLIERGVNIDGKNKWGETALDIARHHGYDHLENVVLLRDRGSRLSVNLGMLFNESSLLRNT